MERNETKCLDQSALKQFVAACGDSDSIAELERHILQCDDCASHIAQLVAADSMMKLVHKAGTSATTEDEETNRITARLMAAIETRLVANGETFIELGKTQSPEFDLSWLEPAVLADELGRLGDFRVLRLLGRGGMGAVFEAEDQRLRRRVALKVMLPGLAGDVTAPERFLREAQSAAAVHHRNVVTIFEVGKCGVVPFLAMELLVGESLEDRLRRECPLSSQMTAAIGAQIAEGLAAAHERGLLHRDIKPANIWLESPVGSSDDVVPTVKLLDFGLARSMMADKSLTQSGVLVGTLNYLSPEQARGEQLDGRSDLFGLGCVLYRMLTGQSAFGGKDVLAILNSLATVTPHPVKSVRSDVPDELSELVEQLLEKDCAARPPSAQDVARRMAALGRPVVQSTDARKTGRPGAAILRFAMGLAACVLFGVIVITLKNRDGKVTTIKVDVPEGTKLVSVEQSAPGDRPRNNPEPSRDDSAKPFITLDRYDPATIPVAERFAWQPQELVAVLGEHRLRHWSSVREVVFHPGGEFFLTIPHDNGRLDGAKLWLTRTLEAPSKPLDESIAKSLSYQSVVFSRDGTRLFTGGATYDVDVRDPQNPQISIRSDGMARFLPIGSSHGVAVAVHRDRWVLRGGETAGNLQFWDTASNPAVLVKTVKVDTPSHFQRLSLSDDGRRLLVWLWDYRMLVGNVDWAGESGPTVTWIGDPILAFFPAISHDGSLVLSSEGEVTQVRQVTDNTLVPSSKIEEGHFVAISGDDQWLATGYARVTLYRRQGETWSRQHQLTGTMGGNFTSGAFSPDGKLLVVGDTHGGAYVWDLTTSPPSQRNPSPPGSNVYRIGFSPDGRWLLAENYDGQGALWNLDGPVAQRVEGNLPLAHQAPPSFSPDSSLLRVADGVWTLKTMPPQRISDPLSPFSMFDKEGNRFFTMNWLNEPNQSVLQSQDWELTKRGRFVLSPPQVIWSGKDERHIPIHRMPTLSANRRFATLHTDGFARVWNLDDARQPLVEVRHQRQNPGLIELSPDGRVLVVFSQEGSVVWDLEETPPREYRIPLHAYTNTILFGSSNNELITADGEGVLIYDWVAKREIRRIASPLGGLRQVTRHPDGHHLITVNANGTVYILRLAELAEHSAGK